MHERKKLLIKDVDAVVALPGGCGTLEELMEVITLKRLGKFTKPIVILNLNGFYNPLVVLLQRMIDEKFMRPEHGVDATVFHLDYSLPYSCNSLTVTNNLSERQLDMPTVWTINHCKLMTCAWLLYRTSDVTGENLKPVGSSTGESVLEP